MMPVHATTAAAASVTVAALYRYPLKSARGILVDSLEFDARGPVGDRRWMLIDADRRFLSQRPLPRMALMRPALEARGLVVDAPGMSPLVVPCDPTDGAGGKRLAARLFESTVTVQRVGDDADRWFSEFLGLPCSIVTMPDDAPRQIDPRFAPLGRTVAFADGYPALIIGAASLDDLNRRLQAKGVPPVGFDRFRPNIVVSGGAPHEEDGWKRLVGPGVTLDLVKPCGRCAIITVDQHRGVRVREPLATLNEYRQRDQKVLFGQYALHDRPGRVAYGETLVPEPNR